MFEQDSFFKKNLPCNEKLFQRIVWESNTIFKIGEIGFEIDTSQDRARSVAADLSLSKPVPFLDAYFRYVDMTSVKNLLEIGFFRGGGAGFFFELLQPDKLVSLELKPFKEPLFESYKNSSPRRAERLSNIHDVNQADQAKLQRICDAEFEGDIDIVIDDASHLYAPTKASFEALFPRVRPGGYYIIEDWGWAHRPGTFQEAGGLWADQPALTNLIFELLILHVSRPSWFENVVVLPFMAIFKAGTGRPKKEFRLEDVCVNRGKSLTLI